MSDPLCHLCGRDPNAVEIRRLGSDEFEMTGHACHCVSAEGKRLAVGICCGRMLGAGMLADEIESDERWWAKKVVA